MKIKPTIYIAGPLFTIQERAFLEEVQGWIHEAGVNTFLPHIDNKSNLTAHLDVALAKKASPDIFKNNIDAIDESDAIVALLDGLPCDAGTCIELGYAYAKNKPILGIRTDYRIHGNHNGQIVDPMTQNICNILCYEPLNNKETLKKNITKFVISLINKANKR